MAKTWQVREQDPELVNEIARSHKLNKLLVKCLLNRGVDTDFLSLDNYQPPDPFLMPDMELAVARICDAIEAGERICIYGDYDADGVTAISILMQALETLGADVFYYIPDRFFEGVGLHNKRLALLKEKENVGLIITVDTGVRAFEEMHFAASIDLDIIVTDHHTPDEQRPAAYAVLNPKITGSQYPFDGLCGAGVAFKLVQALDQRLQGKLDLDKYLQIAAIGTIADMVPLVDENRWLVARGIEAVGRDTAGPIRCLLRKVGIRGEPEAMDISFKVAPRINAPGRLGDPDTAIAFFNSSGGEDTVALVDIMDGMNTVRQMLEREIEAKAEIQLRHSICGRTPPSFIMLAGRQWHRGILGILACKVLRRYSRPTCVLSFDNEYAYGSIRGLPGGNLLEPLQHISPLLTSFGGHPEAAGICLPLTNLPQFKQRMNEILAGQMMSLKHRASFAIDAVLPWTELGPELFRSINKLAPFGIGNALPVFMSFNLILESELLRKGPWYHFEASDGHTSRKCSFYHPIDLNMDFERFDSIDLVYSIMPFRDDYQLQIVEMRPSKN